MIGKAPAVFPAVTFRNVTVQVHFGVAPLRPLPFKCHTWQEVQKAHSEVKTSPAPKDGKYQVLLPVGLPDEATFDWVDQFLSKNKNYTEISDRSILDWANRSGLQRSGGYFKRSSHDHPEMHFGLPLMDDYSVSKVLKAFATVLPRNFIIAEVKNNLLAEERQKTLSRFPSHCYTKEVRVLVGEPAADYKTFIQE
ncbi:Hnrnpu, partial [Symbiodinium pilosum]